MFLSSYIPFFILFFLFGHGVQEVFSQESECRPIIHAGVRIGCLEKGIGSFSAKERVEAIQRRVSGLAKETMFDPGKIKISNGDNTTEVVAEDLIIVSVRDEDINASGTSREETARTMAINIQKAIQVDRTMNSPKTFIWGAVYTLLATLCLIAILLVIRRIYPRFYKAIESREEIIRNKTRIQDINLLNPNRIISFFLWLARASRVIITITIFYIYIPLVLSFFPLTANWAPKLYGYIINPLITIFHVFVNYIPKLFFVIAIAVVTNYLLKLIKFFFSEIEYGRLEINGFFRDWAQPTYKLIRVLVIAFGFIMAFPYLPGSDSPAFQGVSVFLGILLSLGSSSAVANIVAGVVITYMRPFKVGDRVKIADTMGDVIEKTLLVTRIRSIKNVDVTIPNSMVLGSHIINYSSMAQQEGLVLNTTITIGYDAPWKKVHELLKEAAKRTELISKDKEPFVLQTALNDFYVSYELNAYTHSPNKMALIYSELHQHIQDTFNEAGVEIMSPHYSTLRDGNETTIPENYRSKDYEASKFRVAKD